MSTRSRGFTLIELLVTLVILGVLASAAVPAAELAFRRHKEAQLQKALDTVRNALDAYKQAADEGHIHKEPTDSGYPPTLSTLVTGVDDAKSSSQRRLYFLRRIPPDPFADEHSGEKAEDQWGLRSYESEPNHPRPGSDVFDIYSRSAQVGLNGISYGEW